MMRVLVDGSAWISAAPSWPDTGVIGTVVPAGGGTTPPGDWPGASGGGAAVAGNCAVAPEGCRPTPWNADGVVDCEKPVGGASPPPIPSSVRASRVASAFFRYTTWMLPGTADGWSSFAISPRTRLERAGLVARISRE